ncbi:MAG: hypothetical protein ISS25_02490 [Nanoarchaeota archaeon]|nr:hypothetical protein [DPANN group archaeon]MBL7116673.1 hypothetical protein [Nanoarchaeota archaeon]
MKILLLTKTSDICREMQDYVKTNLSEKDELLIFEGEFGDTFPKIEWKGDYILSFLSSWILPEELLQKAKISLNFHPAPPKYPGIGCYNFAIYNKDREYGVTCHHMISRVDSGKIVKVLTFPMYEDDNVAKLKDRTMDYLVKLFQEVFELILKRRNLPKSNEQWVRKPYTRKEFQELCRITPDMDDEEIKLRVRATFFPGVRDLPYIEISGSKIILEEYETIKANS